MKPHNLTVSVIVACMCSWMVTAVKHVFGYDDTLDAFGAHGGRIARHPAHRRSDRGRSRGRRDVRYIQEA
jgi:hypothetical protein